jgi:hypothetical protein
MFASGAGQFTEAVTLFGTVLGREGAVVLANDGTTTSTGTSPGRSVITQGIGGLTGLRGTVTIQGINATSSSYTGQVSFGPE